MEREFSVEICRLGDEINGILERSYGSPLPERLGTLRARRTALWLQQPDAAVREKRESLLPQYRRQIDAAVIARDDFSLFRTLWWLDANQELAECAASPFPELAALRERGQAALAELMRQERPKVYREEILTATAGDTLSQKHIFRLESRGQALFTEAFEHVTGLTQEETTRQSLCVPTAIGCACSCRMCDIGTFYARELRKEEMLQIIGHIVDVHTVGWKRPDHLRILYLGGGEPAYNKDILSTLPIVAKKYPGSLQVVSTVGIEGDFNDCLIALADENNVGFQISLYSLDDAKRRNIINNHRRALGVRSALSVLERYHARTGRKGRAALALLDGLPEAGSLERRICENVDRDAIHISLQRIQKSGVRFPYRSLPVAAYEELQSRLAARGYSVSIYDPPDMSGLRGSCGVVSDRFRQRIEAYRKPLRAEALP